MSFIGGGSTENYSNYALVLFTLQQMPSYPGTPAESSFQSTNLGSVRGENQAAEGGRGDRSNQSRADAVVRSVQVTGTCKAVQVRGVIALCTRHDIGPHQFASGVVVLWYNDGSQLELQSSASAAFKYTDPQGRELM